MIILEGIVEGFSNPISILGLILVAFGLLFRFGFTISDWITDTYKKHFK